MRAQEFITEALLVTDVPNEDWLAAKIEYAKERGRNSFGVPYMGSTTGYVRQPSYVKLPVDLLARIPGARAEQTNVRPNDLAAIMKIMQDTGKLPLRDNGKEYLPFICVAWNGEPYVMEGNHRIMAAKKLGWKTLPVELKYFDGGEMVKSGPLYPGKIGLQEPAPGTSVVMNVDEDWRKWASGAAVAGAAALGGYQAMKQPVTPVEQPPAVQQLPAKNLKPLERVLVGYAQQAGLTGNELKQFLAQCAHETGNFSTLEERGSDKYFMKKYDRKHNPAKAKTLGNIKPGDGVKYKGRGFIQLTGRYNYKKAGEALGLPLEQNPELVERPDVAAKVALWFWSHRVQPKVSDFHDVPQATKPINPALKGLPSRQQHYDIYQKTSLPSNP